MKQVRVNKLEGHYTIKIVDRLPKTGNSNILYAILDDSNEEKLTFKSFYRWNIFINDYDIIDNSSNSITIKKTSDIPTNDGTDGTSAYVENDDLSDVAFTGDYSDLNGAPILNGFNSSGDENDGNLITRVGGGNESDGAAIIRTNQINSSIEFQAGENVGLIITPEKITAVESFDFSAPVIFNSTVEAEDPILPKELVNFRTLDNYTKNSDITTVAFTGDYSDLINTPNIPQSTSNLVNDGQDGNNPFITANDIPDVPEYTLSNINGSNQFNLLKNNVVVNTIDLSPYLDDTNLSRIISGNVNPQTGVATITRDDSTTFTIDFSPLIDVQPTSTQQLLNEGSDGTSAYVEQDELNNVAFTGNYNDLVSIPDLLDYARKSQDNTFTSLQIFNSTVAFNGLTTVNGQISALDPIVPEDLVNLRSMEAYVSSIGNNYAKLQEPNVFTQDNTFNGLVDIKRLSYNTIEEVPFVKGSYRLPSTGLDSSNASTNLVNYLTGQDIKLPELSVFSNLDFYLERNLIDIVGFGENLTLVIDELYINDLLIGELFTYSYELDRQDGIPPFYEIKFNKEYYLTKRSFFENTYLKYKVDEFNVNYIYNISLTPSTEDLDRGIISLGDGFRIRYGIGEVNLYIDKKYLNEGYSIGYLDNSTINTIAIKDESNLFYKSNNINNVNVTLELGIKFQESENIQSIKPTEFTGENIAFPEVLASHGNKMLEVFSSAYGSFDSSKIYSSIDNQERSSLLTSPNSLKSEIIKANSDLIFTAAAGLSSVRSNTYPKEVFKVIPLGSNDLIESIPSLPVGGFLENGVLVTSRSETDNDGTDPKGTSYGNGVEFNEPTLTADMTAGGYNWTGASFNEHQQSPATAIVSGKMKFIKDQTNAPWYIVREACRKTASNANNYNIYRGFGKIDKTAAIAWINNNYLNTISQDLAAQYDNLSIYNDLVKFEDKTSRTPVTKKDINTRKYLTLLNGFTNYVLGFATVKATKVGDVVKLSGLIRTPTNFNASAGELIQICNLGSDFAPLSSSIHLSINDTGVAQLRVLPDGFLYILYVPINGRLPVTNAYLSLENVSYTISN